MERKLLKKFFFFMKILDIFLHILVFNFFLPFYIQDYLKVMICLNVLKKKKTGDLEKI